MGKFDIPQKGEEDVLGIGKVLRKEIQQREPKETPEPAVEFPPEEGWIEPDKKEGAVSGEIEAKKLGKEPPAGEEKVIIDMPEMKPMTPEEEKELKTPFKKDEPEEILELTKKKEGRREFNPANLGLDELDDRVQELWGAMGKIIEDASAWKPSKEEKKKLQKFTKKGGEWPLDDAVTAENFKERLEKYGVAKYINPSLIEKNRDPYAVVSKQYGIYRDALEERIRKAKLKQLEEAEGRPKTKKEKAERQEEVEKEIETKLPPEGAGTPAEFKEKSKEEIEAPAQKRIDIIRRNIARLEAEEAMKEEAEEAPEISLGAVPGVKETEKSEEPKEGAPEERKEGLSEGEMTEEIRKKFKEFDVVEIKNPKGEETERCVFRAIEGEAGAQRIFIDRFLPDALPGQSTPSTFSIEYFYKNAKKLPIDYVTFKDNQKKEWKEKRKAKE